MRRPIPEENPLKPHRPLLFWKPCCVCGQEFRRENGWYFTKPGANHRVFDRFICATCGPTEEAAREIRRKDLAPPPPPGRISEAPPRPQMGGGMVLREDQRPTGAPQPPEGPQGREFRIR